MILFDAHVHIHPCFDLNTFFEAAEKNLRSQAGSRNFQAVLILAEQYPAHYFERLRIRASREDKNSKGDIKEWIFLMTDEEETILGKKKLGGKEIFIISGQQLNTSENIEVLSLATRSRLSGGKPIAKLIDQIRAVDGIPVLPWGVGKWLGRRGHIVSDLIRDEAGKLFCLGDNSGRPNFWKQPKQFKIARELAIPIFPGSDPLPFPSEQKRAGTFGFAIDTTINPTKPAESLRAVLSHHNVVIRPFGRLERFHRFGFNQVRMQLRKRLAKSL